MKNENSSLLALTHMAMWVSDTTDVFLCEMRNTTPLTRELPRGGPVPDTEASRLQRPGLFP